MTHNLDVCHSCLGRARGECIDAYLVDGRLVKCSVGKCAVDRVCGLPLVCGN